MMRYIGSKSATLSWLSRIISDRAPSATSICDPFAGTCTVARHFKGLGMRVVTGDVLKLSHVLQIASVGCDKPPSFENLVHCGLIRDVDGATAVLAHLQALPGVHGYICEEFSPAGKAGRLFFTAENAAHIDAIRREISVWDAAGLVDERESAFLRASLIYAADRVANTAGTYYAYLKRPCRRASLPLRLMLPSTTCAGSSSGCHNADALEVVATNPTDILYLDPPYNQRDYAAYYHLPDTLAWGDEPPTRGRSGTPPPRVARSDFYRVTSATGALKRIVAAARARHVVVHYAADGIVPHQAILDSLRARGEVRFEDLMVRAYSSRSAAGAKQARHRLYWCDVVRGRD